MFISFLPCRQLRRSDPEGQPGELAGAFRGAQVTNIYLHRDSNCGIRRFTPLVSPAKQQVEGIVAKLAWSQYVAGQRTRAWLKKRRLFRLRN
jgi:hypothetical protein